MLHFWRTSRTKRSFWRLGASLLEEVSNETLVLETWCFTFGASLLEEVSYEALVLETWCVTFGGSLVRNARFGDLVLQFWRKSRTKRSFWRLGASLLEEVSYEALETWRFTFAGSLVRNARFGDSLLEEVSYETLALETWPFTFGGSLVRSARFGDLLLHFWRKSRTKRSFWRLGASLLEEVSYEALVLETWCFTFGGSLVRSARFGDLVLHLWSTERSFWRLGASTRTKPSFWRLGTSLLEEVSYEALVLETWCFTFWRKSRTKRSFWRLGASLFGGSLVRSARLGDLALTFGGSLVRSARFGDLALHFWRKSRRKRSFSRLGPSLPRKSRTKRAFWRLGASLLEEVSHEALVLETWCFTSLVTSGPLLGSGAGGEDWRRDHEVETADGRKQGTKEWKKMNEMD